jgi:hypothetical protein
MAMTRKMNRSAEKGSVFFYIILGVALFAALAFTISRGMRSQTTDNLTKRQMEIAASELMDQAQIISRALDKVRQNQISESDICFAHADISAVNNASYSAVAGCSENKGMLYDPAGGNLAFSPVPADWLDEALATEQGYGEWMFSDKNSVIGLGSGALNQASSVELIAHVNHLKKSICEAVNKELGIAGIPDNAGTFAPVAPFSGVYSYSGQIDTADLSGKKAGCFHNTASWDSYVFYTVLIERD